VSFEEVVVNFPLVLEDHVIECELLMFGLEAIRSLDAGFDVLYFLRPVDRDFEEVVSSKLLDVYLEVSVFLSRRWLLFHDLVSEGESNSVSILYSTFSKSLLSF